MFIYYCFGGADAHDRQRGGKEGRDIKTSPTNKKYLQQIFRTITTNFKCLKHKKKKILFIFYQKKSELHERIGTGGGKKKKQFISRKTNFF